MGVLSDVLLGTQPDTALSPYGLLGPNPSLSVLQSDAVCFSSPPFNVAAHGSNRMRLGSTFSYGPDQ